MPAGPGTSSDVASLRRFAFELSEFKRQHCHEDERSAAGDLFAGAWSMLAAGGPPRAVALHVTAAAIAGTVLGPLRLATLAILLPDGHEQVAAQALAAGAPTLPENARALLAEALRVVPPRDAPAPAFAALLLRQPRAGATAPGKPRLTLLPAENHGEHCLAVAVLGVVMALRDGADVARVFLAGMSHHLHNAHLPDAGFAGEVMLGASLDPLVARLTAAELAGLAPPLRAAIADSLELVGDGNSVDGRCFNAADVIDRVVQQHTHERANNFRARHALEDLEIVHEGPLQRFGHAVLREHDLL